MNGPLRDMNGDRDKLRKVGTS